MPSKSSPLRIERTFNATPEKLWTYWTDPAKYAKWLNPHKANLIIKEFDVRVGGKVNFIMPLDDGTQMPNAGVFHVLDKPNHLVTGDPDKTFLLDVTFTSISPTQTRMVIVATGVPIEHHSPAREGWGKGLDKLAKFLEA